MGRRGPSALGMTIDLDTKFPKRLSTEEAEEDMERLLYLFSHGCSGYAFFNQQGEYDEAKNRILQQEA
jgi:site-specific DNA-adenine methylase